MRKKASIILAVILLNVAFLLPPADSAAQTAPLRSIVVADFEQPDPRGLLLSGGGLSVTPDKGPHYAWEYPPRFNTANDDITWWDTYADGDGSISTSDFVDYHLNMPPQDWSAFTTMQIKYYTSCRGNCTGGRAIQVFIHDAVGGYSSIGLSTTDGTVTFNLPSNTALKSRVDDVIVRVYESFFTADPYTTTTYQRTHLYSIIIFGPNQTFSSTTFWPLPTTKNRILGTGIYDSYWWTYEWVDGDKSPCNPKDYESPTSRKAIISATKFDDMFFGDTPTNTNDLTLNDSVHTTDLISINFFKSEPCTYWYPGQNLNLRWYAIGMSQSTKDTIPVKDHFNYPYSASNPSQSLYPNSTSTFLAFRAHTTWKRGTGTVKVYNPGNNTPIAQVPGSYWNGDFDGTVMYSRKITTTNVITDNSEIVNYAILPDRMLTADVIIPNSGPRLRSDPDQAFSNQQYFCVLYEFLFQSSYTCPPGGDNYWPWHMFIRQTSLVFEGQPVIYVGFSEGNRVDSNGDGIADDPSGRPCEEWWFAKNIGPIYIASYGSNNMDLDGVQCEKLLAGTATPNGYPNGWRVNNPLTHFALNRSNLTGYLRITGYCLDVNCSTDYWGN